MKEGMPVVAVFGSSQVERGSAAYEEARLAGRLLATEGLVVCSGGYGGVMEGVSRGAKEAGGSVIGVTTSQFAGLVANPWVDREVRTADFLERLHTMVEMGWGYLVLKGGIGTLTEISLVWSLLQTHSMPAKPLVMIHDPWQGLLGFCADRLIIRRADFDYVCLAKTPAEAVQALARSLRQQQ